MTGMIPLFPANAIRKYRISEMSVALQNSLKFNLGKGNIKLYILDRDTHTIPAAVLTSLSRCLP